MSVRVDQTEEKTLEPILIAGVRMRGKYSDCSSGFAQIGRTYGRHITGSPFLLHYDMGYRENDADFEACVPVRDGMSRDGIEVRQLPGGRCVSLVHQGPYEDLKSVYPKMFEYLSVKGYTATLPTREVYLKGPGMILRGNPKRYLTEIQIIISREES